MPRSTSAPSSLPLGLYDQIVSRWLEKQLQQLPANVVAHLEDVPQAEMPGILAHYLSGALQSALAQLQEKGLAGTHLSPLQTGDAGEMKAPETHAAPALGNALLQVLEQRLGGPARDEWSLPPQLKLLKEIRPKLGGEQERHERPETPLSHHALFTGTRTEPTLISQLQRELRSANRVDILCSFIKWSGLRLLYQDLQEFLQKPGARLRLLTTTYVGVTEAKALQHLLELNGPQIGVSYNVHRTRLHAKAYLFERDSGFHTAYMGSSNLSREALTDGLEWNIKVAAHHSPHLWHKLSATFETLWNDPEFEPLTLDKMERLRVALRLAGSTEKRPETDLFFDLNPYPFQQEILDRLEAERVVHGRKRHLVVAATGTGKTMIAAFDYRKFAEGNPQPGKRLPSLLFVAHRQEILEQARKTFRAILRDNGFGELLVGGHLPDAYRHVFASIQSTSNRLLEHVEAGHFDYVVVDEFHHSGAATYRALLEKLQPRVLLGLTATPERGDGFDVRQYFDGHISAELRLPEAIERGLLCPFQYFGISDTEDFSQLVWKRGGYDTAGLDNLLTGNHHRARLIIQKVQELLTDTSTTRALGFCVSIAHAEFMAACFTKAGLNATVISADTPAGERMALRQKLGGGELNFLFCVDLFNEGVDIPEVDTVLFLRPTESLTVFLQQLGRGLRRHQSKDCLTVLDFIGNSHARFRFDLRYRALQTRGGISLERQIQTGFPYLPSGCSIVLEKAAQEHILKNVRSAITQGARGLEQALKEQHEVLGRVPGLTEFLQHNNLESDDLYRRKVSYGRLLARAGCRPDFEEADESRYTRGLRRLQHWDDAQWLPRLADHVSGRRLLDLNDPRQARRLLMLHLSLWTTAETLADPGANEARLRANPVLCQELEELFAYQLERVTEAPRLWQTQLPIPLQLHCQYTRDEILAALGHWTWSHQPSQREGVLFLKELDLDAFFITLDKTPGHYSPTTMYEDYALSDTLFHWQSQSTTAAGSATGQRYIHGGKMGHQFLLFVREAKEKNNLAQPYAFLGPASYQSHSGERPMSVVWNLEHPIPAHLLRVAARLAA